MTIFSSPSSGLSLDKQTVQGYIPHFQAEERQVEVDINDNFLPVFHGSDKPSGLLVTFTITDKRDGGRRVKY